MNDDAGKAFWIGTAFGLLIGMLPLMIVGSWIGRWEMKTAAIKANVGYYDSKTGDFKYKILDGIDVQTFYEGRNDKEK